jgi:hypothetical protein
VLAGHPIPGTTGGNASIAARYAVIRSVGGAPQRSSHPGVDRGEPVGELGVDSAGEANDRPRVDS